jgi:DNA-binding transcriptional ArsR family regulator
MLQEMDAELLRDMGQLTRLKVLELLLDGEMNVSELQETLKDVPQGRLSTHLTWLRDCKYVYTRRDGKYIYYGIQDPRIPLIIKAFTGKNTGTTGKNSRPHPEKIVKKEGGNQEK